jgi:hypothetical protein
MGKKYPLSGPSIHVTRDRGSFLLQRQGGLRLIEALSWSLERDVIAKIVYYNNIIIILLYLLCPVVIGTVCTCENSHVAAISVPVVHFRFAVTHRARPARHCYIVK